MYIVKVCKPKRMSIIPALGTDNVSSFPMTFKLLSTFERKFVSAFAQNNY